MLNRRASALYAVKRLGLLSGLKLCLDAGDAASYSSGQTWSDVSGQGTDFYLGDTSGSSTDDPTFNGTAGRLSSGEYFSYDGGDFHRIVGSNPTWINNLHKNNAKFTFLLAYYAPASVVLSPFFANSRGSSDVGIDFRLRGAGGDVGAFVRNGGGSSQSIVTTGTNINLSAWNLCGLSVDEAAGASGGVALVNGAVTTFDATYTSPSASNATGRATIGAFHEGSDKFANGSRMGFFLAWEGVALTQGQLQAMWMFMRHRYGV